MTSDNNNGTYKELVAVCRLPNGKTQIVAIQAFPWRTRMKTFLSEDDTPLVPNKPRVTYPRIEVKWENIQVGEAIEFSTVDSPDPDRSYFTGVVEALSFAESSSKHCSMRDLEQMCGLRLSHLITI